MRKYRVPLKTYDFWTDEVEAESEDEAITLALKRFPTADLDTSEEIEQI